MLVTATSQHVQTPGLQHARRGWSRTAGRRHREAHTAALWRASGRTRSKNSRSVSARWRRRKHALLRASIPVRLSWRDGAITQCPGPDLRMQPRAAVPASPPVQASRRLAPRAAKTGRDDLANTQRPRLPDHRRPLLTSATARPAIQRHRHQPGRPSPRIGLPGYRHAIGTCKHLSAGRAVQIGRPSSGSMGHVARASRLTQSRAA